MSSNIIHTFVDGLIVRVPEHACFCDECRVADRIDNEVLVTTKRYLKKELTFDAWWELVAGQPNTEDRVALRRLTAHYENGPVTLHDHIECVVWMDYQEDPWGNREIKTEDELRLVLFAIVTGYEVRMRTVLKWKRGEPGEHVRQGERK